jgi:hypothetical protein
MSNIIGLKNYKKKGDGLGPLPDIEKIVMDCEKVHAVDPKVEKAAGEYVRSGMSKKITSRD